METKTEQTIGQWLEELAGDLVSTNQDSKRMANILHRVGFPSAVVVCGIVYLKGQGTIEAPPMSIHSIAKMLVKKGKEG